MRRTVVSALSLALLLSLTPAGSVPAQEPDAGAGAGRLAIALWLREESDRFFLYVAYAEQAVGTAGPLSEGGVGRLPCRAETFRGQRYFACRGRVATRPLGPSEFEMHPLMDSARMTIQARGLTSTVRWKAADQGPTPFAGGYVYSPCCASSGVDAYRSARGNGRVLGTRLGRARSGAALLQGAGWGAGVRLRIEGAPRAFVFLHAGPGDAFLFADLSWRRPRPEAAGRR